jgi:hypothetical protein
VNDRAYPTAVHGQKDRGFDAIRSEFGPDMVQRIQNWPRLAYNWAIAQGAGEEIAARDVVKANDNVERARSDRDYAMAQAISVARGIPRDEWLIVPSVAQLRRSWGLHDDLSPLDPKAKVDGAAAVRAYIRDLDEKAAQLPESPAETIDPEIPVDETDVARRKAEAQEAAKSEESEE